MRGSYRSRRGPAIVAAWISRIRERSLIREMEDLHDRQAEGHGPVDQRLLALDIGGEPVGAEEEPVAEGFLDVYDDEGGLGGLGGLGHGGLS